MESLSLKLRQGLCKLGFNSLEFKNNLWMFLIQAYVGQVSAAQFNFKTTSINFTDLVQRSSPNLY